MPFTISHAVFALPIRKIKPALFSTAGLILGSMSPDFEYFIKLEPFQSIGHTFRGLFLQALPISIILALLFEFIVKRPFSLHMTSIRAIDSRLNQLLSYHELRDIISWIRFIISVCIGFGTHIFLDAFTHKSGYFVSRLPVLEQQFLDGLAVYKLLQYSLSVVGIFILVVIIMHIILKTKIEKRSSYVVSKKNKLFYWLWVCFVMITVVCIKLLFSEHANTIGILFVAPISGMVLGIVVSSGYWQLKNKKKSSY